MTTEPLTIEEARRRLLARKQSAQQRHRISHSQWLNILARKEQEKAKTIDPWEAEFEDMAARGLTRLQVVEELGVSWNTVKRRLQAVYNGYAEWPPQKNSNDH